MELSTSDNAHYRKLVEKLRKKREKSGDEMVDVEGFEQYIFEEELSENTRTSYVYALRDFAGRFGTVNKTNVILWKQALLSERSPATVNLRLCAMERYCRYRNIKLDIKRVKVQRMTSIENVLTLDEYNRLIDGLTSDGYIRYAVIVTLLGKTGARISEVLRFTKGDLARGYVDISTKGKIRRVYFPDGMRVQIGRWLGALSEKSCLCQNRYGRKTTARAVAAFLKSCAGRYGINEKHLHPHAFRHMFAVEFLKRNPNISLLADILGHVSVNTTMIYLRMSQEQQKNEIDKAVDW